MTTPLFLPMVPRGGTAGLQMDFLSFSSSFSSIVSTPLDFVSKDNLYGHPRLGGGWGWSGGGYYCCTVDCESCTDNVLLFHNTFVFQNYHLKLNFPEHIQLSE